MPRYFRLRLREISSISVDGVEYTPNSLGVVEVDPAAVTPGFLSEMSKMGGEVTAEQVSALEAAQTKPAAPAKKGSKGA